MALVSQDPVLFSGSVRHNIEYGLHGCTLEKVIEAAKKANAHDFICDLKNGYDTGMEWFVKSHCYHSATSQGHNVLNHL